MTKLWGKPVHQIDAERIEALARRERLRQRDEAAKTPKALGRHYSDAINGHLPHPIDAPMPPSIYVALAGDDAKQERLPPEQIGAIIGIGLGIAILAIAIAVVLS